MKNFKLFLPAFFLFFLGMQNPAIAQAGLTCANPVSLDVNNCIQSKGMGTNETWFSFTAQTTVAKLQSLILLIPLRRIFTELYCLMK